MFMFASPNIYTTKKGDDREGVARKTDESEREQILMSYECLRKFAASRRDSDRAFQSRSLRSCETESSTEVRLEWRKELRGDRGYVEKIPGKYMSKEETGQSPFAELS